VDLTVTEGEEGLFYYTVSDWDDIHASIGFGIAGAPGNVTIGDLSGILVVTPEDPEVGTHTFFVTATDGRGGEGRLRVTLTVVPVNDPPRILVPEDGIRLDDDNLVNLQLRADDPDDEPWELKWSLLGGPDFLSLREDGVVTGLTSWKCRGRHNITVRVVDPAGGMDTDTIAVHVVPHYEPTSIDGLSSTTAFEGEHFTSEVLLTCDEEADLAWEMTSNASWIALDAGELRLLGTPSPDHVGTAEVELRVTDQFGGVDTLSATIEVVAVNDPPRWVDLPERVTARSTAWDMDLSRYVVDEDDPTRSLVFLLGEPDDRLRIQGNFLVGEFGEGDGDVEVTVVVRDPHGATDEANLTVRIDLPSEPDPIYSVSNLFPWVLVALVAALAAGVLLSRRERPGGEREGPD
jgi:hypothetical protein